MRNNPVNFNDPTGHMETGPCGAHGEDCGGVPTPPITPQDNEDSDNGHDNHGCAYHQCQGTNYYELGWDNFGQAWSIWNNPNASYEQRWLAGTYMSYWGGAHIAGIAGIAGLACVAAGPGCVAVVEGALGIGTAADTICGGDMCASEVQSLENPLANITYTNKLMEQASNLMDKFHSFPEEVAAFGADGTTTTITGGDGVVYKLVQIAGEYAGKSGVFEYIISPAGVCNHRIFVPGVC